MIENNFGITVSENNTEKISEERVEITEKAFLVVSEDAVGVTNQIADVAGFIEENAEKGGIYVCAGNRGDMFILQGYILQIDEVKNSIGKNEINIPERRVVYNLTPRNTSAQKIPVLKLLEFPTR